MLAKECGCSEYVRRPPDWILMSKIDVDIPQKLGKCPYKFMPLSTQCFPKSNLVNKKWLGQAASRTRIATWAGALDDDHRCEHVQYMCENLEMNRF
jgi:hypothetical protein